jgi:hypothetical protein
VRTAGILGALLALAVSGARGETAARITIRLVNSARVEDRTLAKSERQAARVLAHAGIEVVWRDCSAGAIGACASELGSGEFWLHVANWKPDGGSMELVGFVTFDPDLARGPILAGVYYPMVKQTASDFDIEEAPILGAAIAHEIGHVLGADHSLTGVMRARFSRQNMVEMDMGGLFFDREQAARIRAGVKRRTIEQSNSGIRQPPATGVIVYVVQGSTSIAVLRRAEGTVVEIFASIGVPLVFRNGRARAAGRTSVSIEMQLDDGEVPPEFHPDAMAYAAPFANAGTRIHILCRRALNPPRDAGSGVFLGHVMAHEIAHVLEGTDHHAAEGVMKAQWGNADIRRMLSGPLPFDTTDADLIHAALDRQVSR